jgi:hypothetical protein
MAPAELSRCLGSPKVAANLTALQEARTKVGEDGWRRACQEARLANAARLALMTEILSGDRAEPAYSSTTRRVEAAAAARDPVTKALFEHSAREQVLRESLFPKAKAIYAPGVSELGSMLLNAAISGEAVETDRENQRWLGQVVAERGWFTISRDGEQADASAWLIVQHSDADPAFQRSMIDVMEPLVARGETSARRFAYLYDRWARNTGSPQRFGIAGACVGPGKWRASPPIHEADGLDERRRAAGLPPWADELAERSQSCAAEPPRGE